MTEPARRATPTIEKQVVEHYSGCRVLVTGASGFLATNLIEACCHVDCTITRVSRQPRLPEISAAATMHDVCGDVADEWLWSQLVRGADVIFHFAAQTSVPLAEQDPAADRRANVAPIEALLSTCRQAGTRPGVVFAGTVTQAGIATRLPVSEDAADAPVTVYDRHKLAAERMLLEAARRGRVVGTSLRLANVYGPGPKSSSDDRGILNVMIRRAVEGKPLTVYGDGAWMRDFVYVDDVVDAFLRAGSGTDGLNGAYFVVGSGRGYTVAEAAELVADRVALRTGRRVEVRYVDPPRPLHPIDRRSFVADVSRFEAAVAWRPRHALADGIDRTIEAIL